MLQAWYFDGELLHSGPDHICTVSDVDELTIMLVERFGALAISTFVGVLCAHPEGVYQLPGESTLVVFYREADAFYVMQHEAQRKPAAVKLSPTIRLDDMVNTIRDAVNADGEAFVTLDAATWRVLPE